RVSWGRHAFAEENQMSNMIGAYGSWAADLVGEGPAKLSFRRPEFTNVNAWRQTARQRLSECLQQPPVVAPREVRVEKQGERDGVMIERVSWQLDYGPRTEALLLKPVASSGPLPAILALHDHGGNKFFGHAKITQTLQPIHPIMQTHQTEYYGGVAWANEAAKRGYAVLVPDAFTFGSRRVKMEDLPPAARRNVEPVTGDSVDDVRAYNRFAADHEHLMAKSLFCAGTTWPGVFSSEDQRALDYLCSRDDIAADRVGCAGLSGGGLRTVFLAGIDDRIRCACCVGMMTTWRDYLLHKAHTHTWMVYVPGLPRDLDYPEILGLRAPLPTLVQNNNGDDLFTLSEMQRADDILREVFAKANAVEAYRCSFYDGPHKFNLAMQAEAWDWFDKWLS
ncbi:MAG: hypothetical protein KDA92_20540, partial [Planctomycetales bacterium]|nr:hypothetical protein [Planctomycetales bacterium]